MGPSDDTLTVRGHLLDPQQMSAVSDDSDNVLVIAGAGTGKTTTLVGKLKYLVEVEKVPIKNILLLSFTNNTVKDLRATVSEELPEDSSKANIMTIHALGNKIAELRSHVSDARSKTIYGKLMGMILEDEMYAGDLLEYVRRMSIFPYSDRSLLCDRILQPELRAAADAIACTDLQYRYVRQTFGQYGVSSAHIDIINETGVLLTIHENNEYAKTASKEPDRFRKFLSDNNIQYRILNDTELAKKILLRWRTRLPNSIGELISRCKSTGIFPADLKKTNHITNKDPKRRSVDMRLELIGELMSRYEDDYRENGLADYEDMITTATEKLDKGYIPKNMFFEYVLVDEYQDVSPILVRLLLALRKCMEFKLFCVGDDWQSIYSFSGGDITQMYGFENIWKKWGPTSIHKIETTYRLPQALADITGRFVMMNTKQMTKSVSSGVTSQYSFPIGLLPIRRKDEIPESIANIMDFIPQKDSVFIIGRTRSDVNSLRYGNRFVIPEVSESNDAPGTANLIFNRIIEYEDGSITTKKFKLRYLTAHSAKGLEADYVFLLADREKKCFPVSSNDDISSLFPSLGEDIDDPEERRLFYVGMTRARKGLFIINKANDLDPFKCESPFLEEIIDANRASLLKTTPICPHCNGPMRLIYEAGELSYVCASYPDKCKEGSTAPTEDLFIDLDEE